MLPYIDLAGFRSRTVMPASDVNIVEASAPGFTATRLMVWQSYINSRLRKRYGKVLPLGQTPPALVAVGTLPPAVLLSGRPVLGSAQYVIAITTGGPIGTAIFKWSSDNGLTNTLNVLTSAVVPLGATGVAANFTAATYSSDNVYASATPVPETVLGWLTALVTVDLYRKRGVNPQDPTILMVREDADRALAELKESADSQDGLLDIAISDDEGSAVDTGGPRGSSEQSPYAWTDKERRHARREDRRDDDEGGGGEVL